jgi:23S rRNA (cytosine1962-C5)-methyltransferase
VPRESGQDAEDGFVKKGDPRGGTERPGGGFAVRVGVNGHSAEWLGRGFPWVYPDEVKTIAGRRAPGDLVDIVGPGGEDLGTGILDDGWISVRRFRTSHGPLDAEWLDAVLARAASPRRLLPPDTSAWRLVNAENDGLPGIRVDVWGLEVCVRLDAACLEGLLPMLVPALRRTLAPRAVHLAWRPDPREKTLRFPPPRLLWGEASPTPVPVLERGVGFLVRPAAGADAGLYPDMRDNRAWLDACWSGREVLNLFAYTGAFSVFAARGGASRVCSVDLSADALARLEANLELNGLPLDRHERLAEDCFRALDAFRRRGRRFDLVLADPPSHSRSAHGEFSVEKDLARLVAACLRVLHENGLLVLACNDGRLSPRAFQEGILDGARRARRRLRLVHSGTQAPDFPSAVDFPEGRYLKFQVFIAE